jgi:hypothetical protein
MSRPESVTNKDIQRWGIAIDNDPFISPALAQNPIIREVCYSGQWLADRLVELNCPDILIARIMYTAGAMCFGRKDPWEVHQDILNKFIDNTLEFEVESNDLN